MVGSAEILTAIRELTNTKQLDRAELHGLLQDGIYAALAKKHGPNVKAEVHIVAVEGESGSEMVVVRDERGAEHRLSIADVTQARLAFHWKNR